jgi:hypothetical protein
MMDEYYGANFITSGILSAFRAAANAGVDAATLAKMAKDPEISFYFIPIQEQKALADIIAKAPPAPPSPSAPGSPAPKPPQGF